MSPPTPHRNRAAPFLAALALALAAAPSRPARAQVDAAGTIARSVQYLKSHGGYAGGGGEAALAALALIKAEVAHDDPALQAYLRGALGLYTTGGVFNPVRTNGTGIYEAGVVILALANLDPVAYKAQIASAASYILSKQKANGSWDYDNRVNGDTSISQYAILGLWEAENAGVEVSARTWDAAAQFFLATQNRTEGGWAYHRDESQYGETVAMTAAGAGSLLICNRQLARYRRGGGTGPDGPPSRLLTPEGTGEQQAALEKYAPKTTPGEMNGAANRAIAWLGRNLLTGNAQNVGLSPNYALYGVERLGALADKEALGKYNWYDEGVAYLARKQRSDGGYDGQFGAECETAWAILFMTKATAKTLRKIEIRRLGGGTLLGGRGLPKDLSALTVAQGRVVVRPMNGAVEGMLAVLEDPRALNAENALAGLVERYRAEGPPVLRPHKDRFFKLLGDPDPGVRKVAAWALARTADLDTAPALIEALRDPDELVVGESRVGLQLLSRKIEGFGPPHPSTPAQREAASRAWRGWYDATRPLSLDGAGDVAAPPARPAAAPGGVAR